MVGLYLFKVHYVELKTHRRRIDKLSRGQRAEYVMVEQYQLVQRTYASVLYMFLRVKSCGRF